MKAGSAQRWAAGRRLDARRAAPGRGAGRRAGEGSRRLSLHGSNLDFARSCDPGQDRLSLKEVKT